MIPVMPYMSESRLFRENFEPASVEAVEGSAEGSTEGPAEESFGVGVRGRLRVL